MSGPLPRKLKALPKFSELDTRYLGEGFSETLRVFVYFHLPTTIVVPYKTRTDFDSVPRIPFVYAAFKGRAHRSALVHDYLYQSQNGKARADRIFRDAMRDEGVPDHLSYPIYLAVVLFGGRRYRRYAKKSGEIAK